MTGGTHPIGGTRNVAYNVAGSALGAPGSYFGEKSHGHATKHKNHAVPHLVKYHGSGTLLTEILTDKDDGKPLPPQQP